MLESGAGRSFAARCQNKRSCSERERVRSRLNFANTHGLKLTNSAGLLQPSGPAGDNGRMPFKSYPKSLPIRKRVASNFPLSNGLYAREAIHQPLLQFGRDGFEPCDRNSGDQLPVEEEKTIESKL